MQFTNIITLFMALAASTQALSIGNTNLLGRDALPQNRNGGNNGGNDNKGGAAESSSAEAGNNNAAATATCLTPEALQTGSQSDGNDEPTEGQSASATDTANFINFCSGETITNGLQTTGGSCNGIVMGKIPATTDMISGIITSPEPMENIAANEDFDVEVQTQGLAAGFFTNAASTYYSAPQDLDNSGKIIGHTHVTIQDMGSSMTPTTPLDPTKFAFFKGINDDGNSKGLLSATVSGGLPAGNYRVCTMTSAANHQPVLMPVAQRGAQDDCQRFTVGG